MKRATVFWVGILTLGWLVDFLFWGHLPGINFFLYIVLCLGIGLTLLMLNDYRPQRQALWLIFLSLFFGAVTFLRAEPFTVSLAIGFAFLMAAILSLTYLGGHWVQYGVADYISRFLQLLGSLITQPVIFLIEERKATRVGEIPEVEVGSGKMVFPWRAVLRGILLAAPVLCVFTALLVSADFVFAHWLGNAWDKIADLLNLQRLPEYLFRAGYIVFCAYLLAAFILHAARKSNDEKVIGMDRPLISPFLGFTEAVIVLSAVILLFTVFDIVQFRYLFGGQANITLEGFTYSEYARRGFGELVAVAVLSLLLLLGLGTVTKRSLPGHQRGFSGLACLLVILVGVILASAFQRLVLYESAYGFSRLRTYTHVFIIWLAILLVTMIVLEVKQRGRFFALAALLTATGFAASLALLNVDGFIVRQNVQRAAQGQPIDVAYLASLSADAVPALMEIYQDSSLPDQTHQAVGAALVCMQSRLSREAAEMNWRSFTLPRYRRDRWLQRVSSDLQDYSVEGYPYVTTPAGETYSCYPGRDD